MGIFDRFKKRKEPEVSEEKIFESDETAPSEPVEYPLHDPIGNWFSDLTDNWEEQQF